MPVCAMERKKKPALSSSTVDGLSQLAVIECTVFPFQADETTVLHVRAGSGMSKWSRCLFTWLCRVEAVLRGPGICFPSRYK